MIKHWFSWTKGLPLGKLPLGLLVVGAVADDVLAAGEQQVKWRLAPAEAKIRVLSPSQTERYGFLGCKQSIVHYAIQVKKPKLALDLIIKANPFECASQPFEEKAGFLQLDSAGRVTLLHAGDYDEFTYRLNRGGKRSLLSLKGSADGPGRLVTDGNHLGIRFQDRLVSLLSLH